MTVNPPRILIGGTGSGCGKTTVTCAIMQALVNRGLKIAAFKCGPDYIDPMFHSKIIGAKSRNLDAFLCGRENVKTLFCENSEDSDLSVIEGVMGFYDGIGGISDENSTSDIANLTKTPAVLVLQCRGMSLSVAAMAEGFLKFKPNTIKAVILNGISKDMCPYYSEIIEKNLGIPVLGCLPNDPMASVESRHLGLVTADEIKNLKEKLNRLAQNAEECIDLDALLRLGQSADPLETDKKAICCMTKSVRIAVAKDSAFCFTYEDSLQLLQKMGAELVPFSPLKDEHLPENIHGLMLCGGYPELYAEALSQNKSMLAAISKAIQNGMPTLAECGGFMMLHEYIEDFPMVGIISGKVKLTKRLSNFGYAMLTAEKDNLLCKKGDKIPAHEFHYSVSDNTGSSFKAEKPLRNKKWDCIHATESLFAGYPHIHFYGNMVFAESFIAKCEDFERRAKK